MSKSPESTEDDDDDDVDDADEDGGEKVGESLEKGKVRRKPKKWRLVLDLVHFTCLIIIYHHLTVFIII